jgi:UDPglucose--hexose-1-phosphate uridylyltransferase
MAGSVKPLPRHELVHEDGRRVFVYGAVSASSSLARRGAETGLGGIHKRFDLLTGEWVAISPARNVRPLDTAAPRDDEEGCPVCPGGIELPFPYEAAVFENRFPSFVAEPPLPPPGDLTAPSCGRCELVIYTSRHDTCFGRLAPVELGRLLAIWSDRSRELWADERHEFVMIFENRGAEAGATLSHPHGQIYAFDHLPPITAAKAEAHRRYRTQKALCLGCDLVRRESASVRVVAPNDSFVVGLPFASRWPYEVAVRARRHGLSRLADLTPGEQLDLASALRDVTLRYDALFGLECPYLMVAQEAPRSQPDWHLAFEFFPFQRSRTTTKIRASVETATGLFLNDVLPEDAARRLAKLEVSAAPIGEDCLFVVQPAADSRISQRMEARS